MNTNTDFNKIDKVLAKITGKELKSFVRVYSYTHDDFAERKTEGVCLALGGSGAYDGTLSYRR